MKNVFVPHSQYHTMLCVALIEQQYKKDDNFLILFTDFAITDELKQILKNCFTQVLFLPGTYPAVNKKWRVKAKTIPNAISSMKAFLKDEYDRLFWVCDSNIPEIWLLKRLHSQNKKLEIGWIEDGAYFTNYVAQTGLNNNRFTRSLRKLIGKMIFGKYYSYKNVDSHAINTWNQEYCLTYPDAVQFEFSDLSALEVKDEYFQIAMKKFYKFCDYDVKDGSVLILMDKLDVYKNKDAISDAVKKIVSVVESMEKEIYYKYHPREEDNLPVLSGCNQIPQSTGVEGIYANNIGKNIKVIGIKSTGLQTALKTGFDVASIAVMVNEENSEIMSFYKKIGIEIIANLDEMKSFLR